MPSPKLDLLVLRVADLEKSKEFYGALGIAFTREQHGSGPEHFSALLNGTVLELYPTTTAVTTTRLGFSVASVHEALQSITNIGGRILTQPQPDAMEQRALVADPDGNKIELAEAAS